MKLARHVMPLQNKFVKSTHRVLLFLSLVVLLTALDLTIYLFLWLRQYLVYKSMKMDSGSGSIVIQIFQWTTFSLILGIFLSTTGRQNKSILAFRLTLFLIKIFVQYISLMISSVAHYC